MRFFSNGESAYLYYLSISEEVTRRQTSSEIIRDAALQNLLFESFSSFVLPARNCLA